MRKEETEGGFGAVVRRERAGVSIGRRGDLEALPVHDGGAGLVVLLLADPHLLEGGEGGQDGASDPDGVLPLGGGDDLEQEGGW